MSRDQRNAREQDKATKNTRRAKAALKNEEVVYGAVARAAALVAGYDKWWEVTRWPPE